MKPNNQKRALFEAVTNIDEDLIAEAGVPRSLSFPKNIKRIAAIAAAVAILITAVALWPADENYVTGPGVLVVRAYGAEYENDIPVEGVILEEGVEFTSSVIYNPTISYRQHFPFTFSVDESLYPGMEITLEVKSDVGIFYKREPITPSRLEMTPIENYLVSHYGQHFTVSADKPIYWDPDGFDYEYMKTAYGEGKTAIEEVYKPVKFEESPAFIDVVIRADDLIVGYCVIEIYEINVDDGHPDKEFSFTLLAMVSFPQVEGRWQKVTEEYVQEEINRIHVEREERS